MQVSIFRRGWEGRDPYGAASRSTGYGPQKEGRRLQHLSFLAKSLFFLMVPKGSDTNRAASCWDGALSRKVALFLSQHHRCAHTKPLKTLPSNQERAQLVLPAKGKGQRKGRQDEKTVPPIQVIKHVSTPTRKHASALFISF